MSATLPPKVQKPLDLILDGRIALDPDARVYPVDGGRVVVTVLGDGTVRCTCDAGHRGVECYHQAAALHMPGWERMLADREAAARGIRVLSDQDLDRAKAVCAT